MATDVVSSSPRVSAQEAFVVVGVVPQHAEQIVEDNLSRNASVAPCFADHDKLDGVFFISKVVFKRLKHAFDLAQPRPEVPVVHETLDIRIIEPNMPTCFTSELVAIDIVRNWEQVPVANVESVL